MDTEDVSGEVLPNTTADDRHQADWMQFADVDADGDQDLLLLSGSEIAAERSSLRILRNVAENGQVGILSSSLQSLLDALVTPGEAFDGTTFLLGDLDQDELIDVLVARDAGTDDGTQTRLVRAVR